MYSSAVQVTSRGCSRAYVICVLWRGMIFARTMFAKGKPISFPIPDAVLMEWITQARHDCSDTHFQKMLGGVDYFPKDSSTYWTQPFHFNTWWKNNVERKEKSLSLLKDAMYVGHDEKLTARALYCKLSILLSANIKNHSARVLNLQHDKRVIQVAIPPLLPHHMVAPELTNSDKYVILDDGNAFLTNKMSLCERQLAQKKNKTFHSRMQTKELLSHLQELNHNSSNNSSSSSSSKSGGPHPETHTLSMADYLHNSHALSRSYNRSCSSNHRTVKSGAQLSSGALLGTRQCVTQRSSTVSDETSSLSSEDSDNSCSSRSDQVTPPPPPASSDVTTKKRPRGQTSGTSRPPTYSQRSAALFARKIQRVDSGERPRTLLHQPERQPKVNKEVPRVEKIQAPSWHTENHNNNNNDDDENKNDDSYSTSSSCLLLACETSELHQYQKMFGQESDPPLVHTLPHRPAMRLTNPKEVPEESHLDGMDIEDALSAFSPTASMQNEVMSQNHSLEVPLDSLMAQSSDSYDNEDQGITDDLETARELYYLLHSDNDIVETINTIVSSKSSTPTFYIDPIQTNWGKRYCDASNGLFFPSNGDHYRNPPYHFDDDTFSNTVVEPVHNNTARTPSSCSTMEDSITEVLCDLTMQSERDHAVVSGWASVSTDSNESNATSADTMSSPQQTIVQASSILIHLAQNKA